jgi:hypothetical protein
MLARRCSEVKIGVRGAYSGLTYPKPERPDYSRSALFVSIICPFLFLCPCMRRHERTVAQKSRNLKEELLLNSFVPAWLWGLAFAG